MSRRRNAELQRVRRRLPAPRPCLYCNDGYASVNGAVCGCVRPCWNPDCPQAAEVRGRIGHST